MWFKLWLYVLKEILTSFFENIKIDPPPTWKFSKSDLPYKVKKKILSDFNVFGVKWSVLTRLMHTKKLEVKILILAKVMDKIKL